MEFFSNVLAIPFWSKLADLHGLLAMASLFLSGISFAFYFLSDKTATARFWLRNTLFVLFVNLVLLDIAGLSIYIPYRAAGGPKSLLLGSEETAWLHKIVFEHKEFLAFAPPILIFTAFFIVKALGSDFGNKEKYARLRQTVISSMILALVFILTVAGEAVLVVKVAPL